MAKFTFGNGPVRTLKSEPDELCRPKLAPAARVQAIKNMRCIQDRDLMIARLSPKPFKQI